MVTYFIYPRKDIPIMFRINNEPMVITYSEEGLPVILKHIGNIVDVKV